MVVKLSALHPCRDGAAHKFRTVVCITSGVMVNEKQKCDSKLEKKKSFDICKDLKVKFV